MKNKYCNRFLSVQVLLLVLIPLFTAPRPTEASGKPWITAYVGGWWFGSDNNGFLPIDSINFKGMTVIDHMAVLPLTKAPFIDTALVNNWVTNSMFLSNSLKLTAAAHAAGVKCTFTIGAWGTQSKFLFATTPSNLPVFVGNLVSFLKNRGYDGIDIDWEPLSATDTTQYKNFIIALRDSLPSPYIISVTCGWGSPYGVFASIQNYVDQINIMTYDFDTDAPGYNSWYAAAVYSAGVVDPYDNKTPVVSCDYLVNLYEQAGVKSSKLGIGCEPGGCLWTGISGANQSISTVTSFTPDVSYNTIMKDYYQPNLYHWDSGAKASYLSYDTTDTASDWFLSYDDTTAMKAKLSYIDSAGIGGMIFYEIGMSYDDTTGANPYLDVTQRYLEGVSAVKESSERIPRTPFLSQNYPNPFNPTTRIDYSISKRGYVSLAVYNVLGQKIATLFSGVEVPGDYTATFDGSRFASGVYFYRLQAGSSVLTRKLVLVK